MRKLSEAISVFIFNAWVKKPKFHSYGRIREEADGETVDVTACGLVMYDTRIRSCPVRYSAHLPVKHAQSFAEPCVKCFEVDA